MRAPQIGFPQLVQDFFLRRLVAERGLSPRTVESYRDAFELLFGFIETRTGKSGLMTSSCPRNSNWMCEPALIPNLARMAAGKVTCPLLETTAWACISYPLLF